MIKNSAFDVLGVALKDMTISNVDLAIKDSITVPVWYDRNTPADGKTTSSSPITMWIITAIMCIITIIAIYTCKFFRNNPTAAALSGVYDITRNTNNSNEVIIHRTF